MRTQQNLLTFFTEDIDMMIRDSRRRIILNNDLAKRLLSS